MFELGFTKFWSWKSVSLSEWCEFCRNFLWICNHSTDVWWKPNPLWDYALTSFFLCSYNTRLARTAVASLHIGLPSPDSYAVGIQKSTDQAISSNSSPPERTTNLRPVWGGVYVSINEKNKIELPCGCFALHACWMNALLISAILVYQQLFWEINCRYDKAINASIQPSRRPKLHSNFLYF